MSHEHGGCEQSQSGKNLKIAFILNLVYFLMEIIGALLTNSYALLSDSFHDLGDSVALGVAVFLEGKSNVKEDKKHPLGHKRLRIVAALLTSTILIVGSVIILIGAIGRLREPVEVKSVGMLIVACLGLLINGANVLRLKKDKGILSRSVMLHLLEDAVGNFAFLLASIVIHFTNWSIIDPLFSIVVASMILFQSIKNLFRIVQKVIITCPEDIDLNEVKEKLVGIHNIKNIKLVDLNDDDNIIIISCSGEVDDYEVKKRLKDFDINMFYYEVEEK